MRLFTQLGLCSVGSVMVFLTWVLSESGINSFVSGSGSSAAHTTYETANMETVNERSTSFCEKRCLQGTCSPFYNRRCKYQRSEAICLCISSSCSSFFEKVSHCEAWSGKGVYVDCVLSKCYPQQMKKDAEAQLIRSVIFRPGDFIYHIFSITRRDGFEFFLESRLWCRNCLSSLEVVKFTDCKNRNSRWIDCSYYGWNASQVTDLMKCSENELDFILAFRSRPH